MAFAVVALAGSLTASAEAGSLRTADALLRAGPFADEPFGPAVVGLGDVNGDGIGDVAMLEERRRGRPAAAVVFGRGGAAAPLDSRALGDGGFTIERAPDQVPDDGLGLEIAEAATSSIAAAGDVNGDGLGDVVLGGAALGNSLRRRSGSAFVVFGKRDAGPVRLDALGDRGFRIDGPRGGTGVGSRVAGLGDLDGDGRGDLGIGGARSAYVVLGKADGALVDLRNPAGRAYAVSRFAPADPDFEDDFHAVGAVGDANGDGRGDLLVAVDDSSERGPGAWVVFGKPGTAPVDLRRLGAGGYAITGTGARGSDQELTSGAGDVNGDGRGDVLTLAGATAFVAFGRAEPGRLDVRARGAALRIVRLNRGPEGLRSAAGVGDLDGDGLADLAFGFPSVDGSCRTAAGELIVVRGRRAGLVDARRLRGRGFRLLGDESGGQLGSSVAGLGDVTGDGRPDLGLDVRVGGTRELHVVTGADTRRAPPRRGTCLSVEALTGSVRAVRRQRRVRVRIRTKEPVDELLVSLGIVKCGPRECWEDPTPGFEARVLRFRRAGTRELTLRVRRSTLRALRGRNVTALSVCAGEEACAELPVRRRRRG